MARERQPLLPGKSVRNRNMLWVMNCSQADLKNLKQEVKRHLEMPIHGDKNEKLLGQHMDKFDPQGIYRRKMWTDVENSTNARIRRMLNGSLWTKALPNDWGSMMRRVKAKIVSDFNRAGRSCIAKDRAQEDENDTEYPTTDQSDTDLEEGAPTPERDLRPRPRPIAPQKVRDFQDNAEPERATAPLLKRQKVAVAPSEHLPLYNTSQQNTRPSLSGPAPAAITPARALPRSITIQPAPAPIAPARAPAQSIQAEGAHLIQHLTANQPDSLVEARIPANMQHMAHEWVRVHHDRLENLIVQRVAARAWGRELLARFD